MIWFSFFSLLFKITLASVRGKGWKGQEKKQKILKVWLTIYKRRCGEMDQVHRHGDCCPESGPAWELEAEQVMDGDEHRRTDKNDSPQRIDCPPALLVILLI